MTIAAALQACGASPYGLPPGFRPASTGTEIQIEVRTLPEFQDRLASDATRLLLDNPTPSAAPAVDIGFRLELL